MSSVGSLKPDEIRDYLLRRLPERDLDRIETAYFSDDTLFDKIEAEEDRLITEYVLGQMPSPDKRQFEDSLLSAPYYRGRVETTRRIQLQLAKKSKRPGRAPGGAAERLFPGRTGAFVLSGLALLLLVSAVASAIYLRNQVTSLRLQVRELSAPVAKAPPLLEFSPAIPVQPAVPEGPALVRLPVERAGPIDLILSGRLLPQASGRRYVEAVDAGGKTVSKVEIAPSIAEGNSFTLTMNPALLARLPLEIQLVTEQASGKVRIPLARLETDTPSPK